ncbi:hypothetical protein [Desulfurobacterium sp.]
MKRLFLTAFLVVLFISNGFADPRVLGFELGKATYSQMAEVLEMKQSPELPGIKADVYSVNPKDTDLKNVERIVALFNKKRVLSAVLMVYPQTCFDSLYREMTAKYKVVYAHLPVVGTKYVRFVDGNTVIILKRPYLKYTTTVIYIRKELMVPPR